MSASTDYYSFKYDLGDKVSNDNLRELQDRKEKEVFYVDRSHRLQKVKSLGDKIYHFFQGQKRVRDVVTQTLTKLADSEAFKKDPSSKEFIEHFFDRETGSIGRMSPRVFDRTIFKKDDALSEYYLSENVIRIRFGQDDFYDVVSTSDGGQFLTFDLENNVISKKFVRLLNGEKLEGGAEEIQKVVGGAIKKLEDISKATQLTKIQQLAIKKIFHESGLTQLSRSEFNRGLIKEETKIEKILMPEFEQKRAHLSAAMATVSANGPDEKNLMAVELALMELLYTEFLFTQALGIDLERNNDGGSGGARYARDRHGRKILVVKPDDEGQNKKFNPQWYSKVKGLFVSPKGCLDGNSEALAEFYSYLLDRKFGLRVVPPTQLRSVHSHNFKGSDDKICSVQMFVGGCDMLGDFIGIPSYMNSFPRDPMLHWWTQREKTEVVYDNERQVFYRWTQEGKKEVINKPGEKIISWWAQKGNVNFEDGKPIQVPTNLMKIPPELLERIATHNGLTEDIDCHPGNVLGKQHKKETPPLLYQIFESGLVQPDRTKEINEFVDALIENQGHQALLDVLLASATNGFGEKITLVKHDGGSSFPHKHPTGYLSTRYKHLFEVLPHFDHDKPFEGCKTIFEREELLESLLMEQAVQSLRNVVDEQVFTAFWTKEENRTLFKNWIFDPTREKEPSALSAIFTFLVSFIFEVTYETDPDFNQYRAPLIAALMEVSAPKDENLERNQEMRAKWNTYFEDHLTHIKGSVQTRMDSWRVMKAFAESGKPMREFFRGVRAEKDFERELEKLKHDGFDELLEKWRGNAVQKGDVTYDSKDLTSLALLKNLGFEIES